MAKQMRAIAVSLFIFSLLVLCTRPAFSNVIPDEQWVNPTPSDVRSTPYLGINADGTGAGTAVATSWLLGQEADGTIPYVSKIIAHHICKSVRDPACAKSQVFQFASTFDRCSEAITVDCVVGIEARSSSGKKLNVTFVKSIASIATTPYEGSQALGIPGGGSAQIVDIPEAPHPGGTQYLIAVHNDGTYIVGKGRAESKSFAVRISAIKMNPGIPAGADLKGLSDVSETPKPGLKFGASIVPNDALPTSCLVYSKVENACAAPYPMPLDVNFKVTLKTSIYLMGWFHGRVSDAATTFSLDNQNIATVSLSGSPVIVPTFAAWYKKSELPSSLTSYYVQSKKPFQGRPYGGDSADNAASTNAVSLLFEPHNYVEEEIDQVNLWMAAGGDKAAASPTRWIFQSIDTSHNQGAEGPQFGGQRVDPTIACYKENVGKFLGVVSTNATQYIAGPPSFNLSTQTLDYKVAAPHYLTNGTTFQGSYSLEINEKLAQCFYNFSDAPIGATISVTGVNGENKIATTSIKSADGFLHLTAQGFTFSSPVIRVKLTQSNSTIAPNPQQSAPTSKSSHSLAPAVNAPAKKTKITCVKGKNVRKVVGTNPKCPTGFKKR